jgi:hypothetical protein
MVHEIVKIYEMRTNLTVVGIETTTLLYRTYPVSDGDTTVLGCEHK